MVRIIIAIVLVVALMAVFDLTYVEALGAVIFGLVLDLTEKVEKLLKEKEAKCP